MKIAEKREKLFPTFSLVLFIKMLKELELFHEKLELFSHSFSSLKLFLYLHKIFNPFSGLSEFEYS